MAGRSLPKLNKARSEVQETSPKGTTSVLELDVDNELSIKKATEQVESAFGRVDVSHYPRRLLLAASTVSSGQVLTQLKVLINNAATGLASADFKTQYEAHLKTNVVGPKLVSVHFRKLLLKSKNPYSIYISSGAGSKGIWSQVDLPMPDDSEAYTVSKAALNMVMLQEHLDFQRQKLPVKTFAVCPGFVVSELRGPNHREELKGMKAGSPEISGQTLLSIIKGERDEDVGKFVHKDGLHPW